MNIHYLVEPLRNFNLKLPWQMYIHIRAKNLSHRPTFFNSSPKYLTLDILYDTVSKKISQQNK